MYEKVYETLYELFGDKRLGVCLDCFTVGTLDSFADGFCPACSSGDEEAIRAFEDAELLVDCLEAQNMNIYGVEVSKSEEAPFAVLNMCYVDIFSPGASSSPNMLMNSLGIA